ncbi:MAG: hypothetical protein ACI4II_05055 [Acutalibacteraceae bacterium]
MKKYFCGWYFKCQSENHTVAIIPAFHIADSTKSSSIQIITDNGSLCCSFDYEKFKKNKSEVELADCTFNKNGLKLYIAKDGVCAYGEICFGDFVPIKYDIMGPFKYVPFMECRHSVVSMIHSADGILEINGEKFIFNNAYGYIEGDRGRSFPKRYAWSHSFFDEGSIMLSVADIPFCGGCFTGIICAVYWRDKEYRIATYLGARVSKINDGEIVIKQGDLTLTAILMDEKSYTLNAPISGNMVRTIHENASCRAYYKVERGKKLLFEFETDKASFEYEY